MTTQNASLAGGLKTVIESAGLGLSAFRDRAPARQRLPYCTINENVAQIALLHGDTDDPYADIAYRQEMQVDLWQARRDPITGQNAEQYDLPDRLTFALATSRAATAPTLINGIRVSGVTRLADPDANIVHHVIGVTVDRRSQVSNGFTPRTLPEHNNGGLPDLAEMVPADCVVAQPRNASWKIQPSEGNGAYPYQNVYFRVYEYVGAGSEHPDGTNDVADADVVSMDWGDGTVETAPYARVDPSYAIYGPGIFFVHFYEVSGTYQIKATMAEGWDGDQAVTYPILIDYYFGYAPKPPNLLVGQAFGIWPIDGYGGPPLPPNDHFNWIDWGDGSPVETPPYTIDGSGHATHVFNSAGSFDVQVEYASGDPTHITATVAATIVGTQAELDELNSNYQEPPSAEHRHTRRSTE